MSATRRPAPWPLFAALALALFPRPARAVALAPGDLLVLRGTPWETSYTLLRLDQTTGVPRDTIFTGAALHDPLGMIALPDGRIVIADGLEGLIAVDPGSGTRSTLASSAALGAAGACGIDRAADGSLLVACFDAGGIRRVSPAGAVLGTVGAGGFIERASDVAVAPDGTLWVSDDAGRVVHLNPANGAQVPYGVGGVYMTHPDGIDMAKDGSALWVTMGGSFFYHSGGGFYAVDPATLAGTVVPGSEPWIDGSVVDPGTGDAFVSNVYVINHDTPYFGIIRRGHAGAWTTVTADNTHVSGLLAVVPPVGASPAAPTTWGRVKDRYR